MQWPTSASLTSHQSNVGNELLPGNNFHSLIVFKLKPLPNSKFYHKHFMLKHNKLKHLFYTNICGVLKLFFVLLSNKFFCFFWTERKLRDLLKNWNQSQNYAINLHWLLNHRIKLILLHSLHMCIHSRYISWCYLYINIWAYSVLIKVM